MRSLATSSLSPQHELKEQVQYSEPLPPWLELEVAAGREHVPKLRAALCRAQLKCKGVLGQTHRNKEQNYTYTGFAEVLDAVREAMASEGISVDQVTCDIEEELHYQTSYGARTVWKWRCICLVTHVDGGCLVRILRPITSVGDKASFIARTAADRTLLMTIMRIAGAKEEAPAQEDRDTRSTRVGQRDAPRREHHRPQGPPAAAQQGPTQHRETSGTPPPALTEQQLASNAAFVLEILDVIEQATTKVRLVTVGRMLQHRALPAPEADRAFREWKSRCAVLGLVVKELQQEARKLGPLPEARVLIEPGTGVWTDKESGEFL